MVNNCWNFKDIFYDYSTNIDVRNLIYSKIIDVWLQNFLDKRTVRAGKEGRTSLTDSAKYSG